MGVLHLSLPPKAAILSGQPPVVEVPTVPRLLEGPLPLPTPLTTLNLGPEPFPILLCRGHNHKPLSTQANDLTVYEFCIKRIHLARC